jgi:hypothetical protein
MMRFSLNLPVDIFERRQFLERRRKRLNAFYKKRNQLSPVVTDVGIARRLNMGVHTLRKSFPEILEAQRQVILLKQHLKNKTHEKKSNRL